MSDDDKKKVNIEDLPVPLKELDKEEQENVTGGVAGVNPTISPTQNPGSPTLNPGSPTLNPGHNPRNP
jgi:hypothetical protein